MLLASLLLVTAEREGVEKEGGPCNASEQEARGFDDGRVVRAASGCRTRDPFRVSSRRAALSSVDGLEVLSLVRVK